MPTIRSPGSGWQQGARRKSLVVGQAEDGRSRPPPRVAEEEFGIQRLDHLARGNLGAAQPGQQILFVGAAQHLGRGAQRLVGGLLADMVEGGPRQFLPQLDEAPAVFLAQRPADRGLGTAGRHQCRSSWPAGAGLRR
jgi:hypothetical protein